MVGRTDALNLRAKLQLDHAEVLRSAGRQDAARDAVRRAVELYGAKGNDVAAGSAGRLLEAKALA